MTKIAEKNEDYHTELITLPNNNSKLSHDENLSTNENCYPDIITISNNNSNRSGACGKTTS